MSVTLTLGSELILSRYQNEQITKTAISRAKNNAARKMVAETKRIVVTEVNATRRSLGKQVVALKNVPGQPVGVTVSGKPIAIMERSPKQTGAGVAFRLYRSGPRVLLRGAFVTKVASPLQRTLGISHQGVFKRVGKARLKIHEKFTAGVAGVFRTQEQVDRVLDIGRKEFLITLERNMKL